MKIVLFTCLIGNQAGNLKRNNGIENLELLNDDVTVQDTRAYWHLLQEFGIGISMVKPVT